MYGSLERSNYFRFHFEKINGEHFFFKQASSCSACGAGSYSGVAWSSCSSCPHSYYCPGASDKIECPVGTYSGGGLSACLPCPSTQYSEARWNSCPTCPVGHFCPGSTDKIPCPIDSFSDVTGTCNGVATQFPGSQFYPNPIINFKFYSGIRIWNIILPQSDQFISSYPQYFYIIHLSLPKINLSFYPETVLAPHVQRWTLLNIQFNDIKGPQCYFNGICLGSILQSWCSTKMSFSMAWIHSDDLGTTKARVDMRTENSLSAIQLQLKAR